MPPILRTCLLALFFCPALLAQNWSAAPADTLWSNGANWSGGVAPVTEGNATFNSSSSSSVQPVLTELTTLQLLTYSLPTVPFSITAGTGGSLTLDVNSTATTSGSSSTVLNQTTGTLTLATDVILTNTQAAGSAGGRPTLAISGANTTLNFPAGYTMTVTNKRLGQKSGNGTLNFDGALIADSQFIVASGTLNFNPTALSGSSTTLLRVSTSSTLNLLNSVAGSTTKRLDIGGSGTNNTGARLYAKYSGTVTQALNIIQGGVGGSSINLSIIGADIAGAGTLSYTGTVAINSTATNHKRVELYAGEDDILIFTNIISGGNTGTAAADADNSRLVISGPGKVVLNGANTYGNDAGTVMYTEVNNGTLLAANASGSATGVTEVRVASGAVLGGSGTITGTVNVAAGGILRPGGEATMAGNGHDRLILSGDVTLNGASRIELDFSGPTLNDQAMLLSKLAEGGSSYTDYLESQAAAWNTAADGDHDVLQAGQLTLTADGVIELTGTPQLGDVFDLLDWTSLTGMGNGGFDPGSNRQGGNAGSNLYLPLLPDEWLWEVSLFSDYGILVVIPEPSRTLLAVIGLACLGVRRKRPRIRL